MSVSELAHFGHGGIFGPSLAYKASRHLRTMTLTFTSAGGAVTLPDARTMPGAGPDIFYFFNDGVNDFDVEDANGGFIGVIDTGTVGTVDLSDKSTEEGVWHLSKRGTMAISTPDTILSQHTAGTNVGIGSRLSVVGGPE